MKYRILAAALLAAFLSLSATSCTDTNPPDDDTSANVNLQDSEESSDNITSETDTADPQKTDTESQDSSEETIKETPEDSSEDSITYDEEQNSGPQAVNYTLQYYDIVEDKMLEYTDTQVFEDGIRPMFFIEKLSELTGTTIAVNSIKINGAAITVDYSTEGAPFHGTGSYEESVILDSVAKVLLNVFEEANEIYITADGKEYESGHIYHPKDTPYATRQKQQLG